MSEKDLSSYHPVPPPEEWRDDIIAKAVTVNEQGGTIDEPRGYDRRLTWKKVGITALVGCWLAIAFLKLNTPNDPFYQSHSAAEKISQSELIAAFQQRIQQPQF